MLRDYVCVLSYGQGTTSVSSRKPWSADVFVFRVMTGNSYNKDLMSLLEILKNTTESQYVMLLVVTSQAGHAFLRRKATASSTTVRLGSGEN